MSRRPPPPARGAALLVAMVLLSVVATLAAGMVWQQFSHFAAFNCFNTYSF